MWKPLLFPFFNPEIGHEEIRKTVIEKVIEPVLEGTMYLSKDGITYHINPTGRFVIRSSWRHRIDRKKNYCGYLWRIFQAWRRSFLGRIFKVDRSAAYAARWVAKNIVAADFAEKCENSLSYAIGVAELTSIKIDTFGTAKVSEPKVEEAEKIFDLTPRGIEKALNFEVALFISRFSSFWTYGRTDIDVPWERYNKVEEQKKAVQ